MNTMEEQSVIHSTFVIERKYAATPERVFAAFADPAKKRRWFAEGEHHQLESYDLDFRVGGKEHSKSGFREGHPLAGRTLTNENTYQNIVPNQRVIFTSSMAVAEKCISISLGTVEFLPSEKGTDLTLTFQSVFLEGADGPEMREGGWRKLLEKLTNEVAN
jgi:uncharacterized protein YndB with AHSA1/START domain